MQNSIQSLISNPYIIYPVIIWSLVWKGLALWRAARMKHAGWFIALMIINTLGIFEIIYLIATHKKYKKTNGYIY